MIRILAVSALISLFMGSIHLVTSSDPRLELGANTIRSIADAIKAWQHQYEYCERGKKSKPFVTLTYAQSIDGKIALVAKIKGDADSSQTSSNFPLSDPEALCMTHALRSLHDAILVGGNTLLVDNPRLNNRLWSTGMEGRQPRPVVLDTHLEHTRRLGHSCRASKMIVCCSYEAAEETHKSEDSSSYTFPPDMELLPCQINSETGRIDLPEMLQRLKETYGIKSIMVEGGAGVISAFYQQQNLIDCLCISIAPKLLLWEGLPAIDSKLERRFALNDNDLLIDTDKMVSLQFLPLGKDVIFYCRFHFDDE